MSFEWPVAPLGGFDQSSFSPSREDINDVRLVNTHLALPHLRWRRDALQPPEIQHPSPGTLEGLLDPLFPHNFPGKENTTASLGLPRTTTSMGNMNFYKPFRYWPPHFRVYGTFIPNNLNAGRSAICIHENLLPEGAIVAHVVTCQGRDHIVTMQSGARNLVVVSVHLKPDLTLRNLREMLRIITPHSPLYPDALGVITGDFNICEPEEGRFNSWNQTFSDGDAGKMLSSVPYSLTFSKLRSDATADGTIRTLSRTDWAFINLPKAEAQDFHCYSHVFENLGERSHTE